MILTKLLFFILLLICAIFLFLLYYVLINKKYSPLKEKKDIKKEEPSVIDTNFQIIKEYADKTEKITEIKNSIYKLLNYIIYFAGCTDETTYNKMTYIYNHFNNAKKQYEFLKNNEFFKNADSEDFKDFSLSFVSDNYKNECENILRHLSAYKKYYYYMLFIKDLMPFFDKIFMTEPNEFTFNLCREISENIYITAENFGSKYNMSFKLMTYKESIKINPDYTYNFISSFADWPALFAKFNEDKEYFYVCQGGVSDDN